MKKMKSAAYYGALIKCQVPCQALHPICIIPRNLLKVIRLYYNKYPMDDKSKAHGVA